MKLSFVNAQTLYPFHIGGTGVVARNLVEQFDKRGVPVEFYLIWDGPALTSSNLGLSSTATVRNIRERRNLFSSIPDYFTVSGDIVHFITYSLRPPHAFFPFICRLRSKPMVISVHGYRPLEHELGQGNVSWHKRLWMMNVEQKLIFDQTQAKIVVHSEYMKRLTSHLVDPDRIRVLPMGVDVKRFENRGKSDGITVTFVGRLVALKGVRTLIHALGLLKREVDFQAFIIGEGPLRSELEGLIAELGLSPVVHLSGRLDDHALTHHLAKTDIMVVPSLYEPVGIVILEAFAAGVPVVASNVGGIPEVVKHKFTGLLVTPNDRKALASAIKQYIIDKELRKKVADNAKQIVQEHDWPIVAEKYSALYNELLSRNLS